MSLVSWYRSQYATWNRTRSLQQTPYLATTDTEIARVAVAMHNQINVTAGAASNEKKKTLESLFGPNIGVVSSGPAWTAATDKKVLTDELTPEIVTSWVEKSKDTSQPTTTLQALVNLKRPTLRLSPLSSEEPGSNVPDAHHDHHGLEFEYDCDAPKCGIYVHVFLPKQHPDAPVSAASSGHSKLLVFESVVEGGFGKLLKLEEGALLELGRFEHVHSDPGSTPPNPSAAGVADNGRESVELSPTDAMPTPIEAEPGSAARVSRRRFTHFNFRKRSQNRNVSGPALAVVDAEPPPTSPDIAKGKDDLAEGVKVTIRLAALDDQGTELTSPNEQITYLHIVRFGVRSDGEQEDTRPWVVKVVKREATIGPHTFHLHEIFGLTSSSTAHSHAKTAPLPSPASDTHTYPPVPVAPQTEITADEDALSECLLCLSNPREVVLLPCRHLVACKDCALNMVEFGAGGNITQAEDPVPAGAEAQAVEGANAADTNPPTATPLTPATPALATRRKRKAKGWFCPVCRQPYTSLLRITATPPDTVTVVDGDNKELSDDVTGSGDSSHPANENGRNGGLLRSNFAPSFLRGLTLARSPQNDVESQAGTARAGT